MKQFLIFLACLAITFGGGFYVGQNRQKVKYITKQVEVIKYVEKEKAAIYSKPNASRDQLLQLMRNDIF